MEPVYTELEKEKKKFKKERKAWVLIVLISLCIGLILGPAAGFFEGYHQALQEFGIIASCPGCF